MIRFRCHRCKRPIAAPDGHVGKKVKCPGCMIVTIVPDIPGAQAAKALRRPESRPAPVVERGPVDPLDQLAAAVDDVETASFDQEDAEEFGFAPGDFAAGDAGSNTRRRVRAAPRRRAQNANLVLWVVLFLLVVAVIVGIVLVINQRRG